MNEPISRPAAGTSPIGHGEDARVIGAQIGDRHAPHTRLDEVAAVIVHHRSYDTVPVTVRKLIGQGLAPHRIVVVDNSEDPPSRATLAASLPPGVELTHVTNRGYGAAVNHGLDLISSIAPDNVRYVLVATHEAYPEDGAVARLRQALVNDPTAAVAGPTLLTDDVHGTRIWSQGGYFTRVSHRPKHHGFMDRPYAHPSGPPVPRAWLDGAFLLYRYADLSAHRFYEDYFLYMEETDLHLRLRRAGRTVLWVPDAAAWQSSQGVPAYWYARNTRLLYARNDTAWRSRFVARALVLRRLAGSVRPGGPPSSGRELIRGTTAPLPPAPAGGGDDLVLLNPLGCALHHYELEVASILPKRDRRITRLSTAEPFVSGRPRIMWFASYLALLARAALRARRGRRGRVMTTWPVLGYWDLVLLRLVAGRRSCLVIHDPVPLVPSIGYGRCARALGTWLGAGVGVIVHSEEARAALDPRLRARDVVLLPHPMAPPRADHADRPETAAPTIRVLGRYKPDRDLEALRGIAADWAGRAVLEIHGQDWPQLDGWHISSGFVTEAELDRLISTSTAVVIPYKRLYQSGIAIRCLEHVVPIVGPRDTNLGTVFGVTSRLLVGQEDGWSGAIEFAITRGRDEALLTAWRWLEAGERAWADWDAQAGAQHGQSRV